MKICVFGAGGVGSHLAARLARGGAEVSVIARGDHLAAVRRDGILVRTPDCEIAVRVMATDDARDIGPQDAVIVTVKAPSLPSVAADIAPLLAPHTPVVFAMNGIPWWYFFGHGGSLDGRQILRLDPGGAIWRTVGPRRAVGGVIYAASTVVAPGIVRVATRENKLILGEPDGSRSKRTADIATLLRGGGMSAAIAPRIRDAIWAKLIQNLAASTMALLAGTAVDDIYREPSCAEAGRRILNEGEAISHALGCRPELDVEKIIRTMQTLEHKSSALQDLERGRPVEMDSLFVVPLEMARMLGVATPTLDLLTALVRLRLRSAGLYEDSRTSHVAQNELDFVGVPTVN